MASRNHLDDDDDFRGDFSENHTPRHSGWKRRVGDIEDDLFGSKKANIKAEDNMAGAATGMIHSLVRVLLMSCSDQLMLGYDRRSARRLLVDPAIREEFTRLKNLDEEKDKKVKELQENITVVNFTAQSKMCQMLMAKCRMLQEENKEIGNQAAEGKIHELTMKLALQKSQNAELWNQFEGLYKHLEGLTDEVERCNEMVIVLQEKLEEKDRELRKLKDQLQVKGEVRPRREVRSDTLSQAGVGRGLDNRR